MEDTFMTHHRSFSGAILLSAVVICAATVDAAAAPPAPAYRIADLGALGEGISEGRGINSSGQVAGYSRTIEGDHAFLYDGTMHDLGTLGGGNSSGIGINASGQVAGWSDGRAFLYDGMMHDLTGTSSRGLGINA